MELLAIKNRNSTISVIELPSNKNEASRLKTKQMVDNTTLSLHNKEDMIEAKSTINTFSLFSGLRLNAKKTKVMKLGSRKNEREGASLPFNIVERIKILGIVFENGETATNLEQNWIGRIAKIKRIIQLRSKRDLSVKEKIVVVKCFLAGQLIFIMQSIGVPEKVLTDLNRLTYKFIWQEEIFKPKSI